MLYSALQGHTLSQVSKWYKTALGNVYKQFSVCYFLYRRMIRTWKSGLLPTDENTWIEVVHTASHALEESQSGINAYCHMSERLKVRLPQRLLQDDTYKETWQLIHV